MDFEVLMHSLLDTGRKWFEPTLIQSLRLTSGLILSTVGVRGCHCGNLIFSMQISSVSFLEQDVSSQKIKQECNCTVKSLRPSVSAERDTARNEENESEQKEILIE